MQPPLVEVRGSRTDSHQLHIDVQAVSDANDVAEEPPLLIHLSVAGSTYRRTGVPDGSSRFVVADACGP
jgi:hypothetical protein